MPWSRLAPCVMVALLAIVCGVPLRAQESSWKGRVVDDRTGAPLVSVEVSITAQSLRVTTDSSGRFTLDRLASGSHQLTARRIGFEPLSTTITAPGADEEHLLRLIPASTELSKVSVTATAVDRRLTLFEAHRASNNGGSFLTAERLQREKGRPLGDVMQSVVGSDIVRGRGSAAFFATRRGYDSFMLMPKAREADRARGASTGLCYAAVVVNNVFVYRGGDDEELFDLNQLPPDDIIAVEVYKGGATMPLEYNTTRKTCGLVVIYTK